MASGTPVCLYNKYGYCKHKEMCRKRHVNEMCEKTSCEVYKCTSRHPKICKFFWNHGHCKFDPCAFLQKDNENFLIYKLKGLFINLFFTCVGGWKWRWVGSSSSV